MPDNACAKPADYADVSRDAWYYDYIAYAATNDIMVGKSSTTFAPNDSLARCELAMILYKIAGCPEVTYTQVFPDVPDGEWYSDAVIWAYQNGIVSGYGNGFFGTSDYVTREQTVMMLYKMARGEGMDIAYDKAEFERFEDASNVAEWAQGTMAWAVRNGLISGKDNKICPQDNTTRAECAAIMYQYFGL